MLLAVVPWALAAVLAVVGAWSRGTSQAVGAGLPDAAPSPVVPTPLAPTPLAPTRLAPSSPALAPAVEFAVVAAARTTLGTAGLVGAPDDTRDRWPLQAAVVAVEAVTTELGVATVHGLVIERTADGWASPRTLAVAVPLALGDPVRVAGPAWPLPAPPEPLADPTGTPVADPGPELIEALLVLGWEVERVESVDLLDGGVLRVRLHGTAPGALGATSHEVWLLDAPGGVRPLPLTPATPGSAPADPATEPTATDPSGARPTEEPT